MAMPMSRKNMVHSYFAVTHGLNGNPFVNFLRLSFIFYALNRLLHWKLGTLLHCSNFHTLCFNG